MPEKCLHNAKKYFLGYKLIKNWLVVPGCPRLPSVVPGCPWLSQVVLGCVTYHEPLAAIVSAEVSNPDVLDQTKMFVAGLLCISSVLLLLRIILVFLRQRQNPIGKLYDNVDSGPTSTSGISTYGSIF